MHKRRAWLQGEGDLLLSFGAVGLVWFSPFYVSTFVDVIQILSDV